jgi:hypothetical protein
MSIELTPSERNSVLMNKLVAHWTERLSVLRTQNEGPLGEMATADLRGRIAECKAAIALSSDTAHYDTD